MIFNKRFGTIPKDAVYVGRPSVYGNPFEIGKDGTRDQVITKYEEYVMQRPWLVQRIKQELKGKDLVCWCWPKRCHAEILERIANNERS